MNTQMIRTTVYLPVDLVALAKVSAYSEGNTLTGLVKDSLEERLIPKVRQKKEYKLGSYNLGNYKFRRADAYE